jgi:hypothetical protein
MPIYPISFSIPESKIVNAVPTKIKRFADIIPGDLKTYIYNTEKEYYKDYQDSLFGITFKKGGWDAPRHYEILANGCIPWFENLSECDETILENFPKDLVKKAMTAERPEIFLELLLNYTRKYLTCRATAQYIFDTVGHPSPKTILFLSVDIEPDYLRCLTLIGMKQLLGSNCVDSNIIPHIYDDFGEKSNNLYGTGFTYTNIISAADKPYKYSEVEIVEKIKSHDFDLIVYGSIHRGMPYWNLVKGIYHPDEVICLCGEDEHSAIQCAGAELVSKCNLFIRELIPELLEIPSSEPNSRDKILVRRAWPMLAPPDLRTSTKRHMP